MRCSRSRSGTTTSVSTMSAFSTVRSDCLRSILVASKPTEGVRTRNPLTWSSATSRAQITTTSANAALPIHRFAPLSTHSSAPSGPIRRSAVVSSPFAVSEPWPGSVSPKHAICSPRASTGSHSARCSSEPPTAIEVIASPLCTPMKVAVDGSAREISIATQPRNTLLFSNVRVSGNALPYSPSSAIRGTRWRGLSARSQWSSAKGRTSVSRNARISRSACCSTSVSSVWNP